MTARGQRLAWRRRWQLGESAALAAAASLAAEAAAWRAGAIVGREAAAADVDSAAVAGVLQRSECFFTPERGDSTRLTPILPLCTYFVQFTVPQ